MFDYAGKSVKLFPSYTWTVFQLIILTPTWERIYKLTERPRIEITTKQKLLDYEYELRTKIKSGDV